jgi:uncharacterized membrane protein
MATRTPSPAVAGALATALTALAAPLATAGGMAMNGSMMMKRRQHTMAELHTGRLVRCFGVALAGHNDCYAGPGAS